MIHNVPTCVNGKRPLATIAYMALLSLLMGACRKKDEKGVTERLMNRWTVVQFNDTSFVLNSPSVPSKYEGIKEDYMDFRKDGKLYSSINNALDTAQYTYSEQNLKVNVQNLQYRILYLTDNSMVLWDPHIASSPNATSYISHKVTLKR
ncbi:MULTISPECIES: hypothetical protein [Niastella]|uniref:Lipocalin-like domain-containing protein n=1 Tax=Niastella soli TaxID=2821487 RepID=A0ABS3YT17_9BACT|nr:hypothetical protein [Niastella soli]MBO9200994.1 hypothetical protein [Niastella soli]